MKKLVMVCRESMFAGKVQSSLVEIIDSLANSVSKKYATSIICIGNENSMIAKLNLDKKKQEGYIKTHFSKVGYYLVEETQWKEKSLEIIESIRPDILHNFAEVELLSQLTFIPEKTVYTFSNIKVLHGKEDFLNQYDIITTTSAEYASYLKTSDFSWMFQDKEFYGIDNGLLTEAFSPTKGMLMPVTYDSINQQGKEICKKMLLQAYNIKGDPYICISTDLIWEKNLDEIISLIPLIKETGGVLILTNYTTNLYQKELNGLSTKDGVVVVKNHPSFLQLPALFGGSDFYINPQKTEMGTLLPLMASKFGAIPLITKNKYEYNIFNEENAIIVDRFEQNVNDMAKLYNNKKELYAKREKVMTAPLEWRKQKEEYIRIYEK